MNYEALGDRILIKPDPKRMEAAGLEMIENNFKQDPWGEVIIVGDGVPLNNIKLDIKLEGTTTVETLDKMDTVLERIERIMELQVKGREIKVKKGDRVHYGQYAGTSITIEGENYIMIREHDVFGRIPQANTGENDY